MKMKIKMFFQNVTLSGIKFEIIRRIVVDSARSD